MKLICGLDRVREGPRRVVTLGNFDGVHLAHQEICRRVVERAAERGVESAAITFHPHPASVLAPARAPQLILPLSARLRFLGETGVGAVIVQRFNRRFSQMEAEHFVRGELVERLGAVHVVVGHSVRFGRARGGDDVLLQRLGAALGFSVEIVGPVTVGGTVVSSSEIRRAITAGEVRRAATLLGRPHFVRGRVVHGRHRGASLGFPTANLRLRDGVLPPDGVYAARVERHGQEIDGVANLGNNPTFGDRERSLEVHLLDFRGDLYGERLRLSFIERLRGEVKFSGVQSLVEQIGRDVEAARAALAVR